MNPYRTHCREREAGMSRLKNAGGWVLVAGTAALLLGSQAPPRAGAAPRPGQPAAAPASPPARGQTHTASGFTLRQREGLNADERDYLGTPQSEAAVQRALKWLATNQSPDGSWPAGQDVGIAGLCTMCFLAAGHQPDRGPYGKVLRAGA